MSKRVNLSYTADNIRNVPFNNSYLIVDTLVNEAETTGSFTSFISVCAALFCVVWIFEDNESLVCGG